MDDKFTQILISLRKVASQNQLYVWLLGLTLLLGVFSYLNKDFFSAEKEIERTMAEGLSLKKASQEDLIKSIEEDKTLSGIFGFTFFLGLLVFLAGIYLLVRFWNNLTKGNISILSESFNPVSWTILDILRVVVIILFFSNFLYIAEPLFFKIFGLAALNIFVRLFCKSLAVDLVALGVVLYFVIEKYSSNSASLGLDFKNFSRDLKMGILHYIGLIPALLAVIFFSLGLARFFKYEPQPQEVFAIFFQPQPKFLLLFFVLFITVLGPLIEEIFFRGFCYPALRKKIGPLKAGVFISIIFAWLHMNMIGFLPIFLLGLLLVYLYEKTNSLIASITVHIIHNSVILYLVFLYRYLVLR